MDVVVFGWIIADVRNAVEVGYWRRISFDVVVFEVMWAMYVVVG